LEEVGRARSLVSPRHRGPLLRGVASATVLITVLADGEHSRRFAEALRLFKAKECGAFIQVWGRFSQRGDLRHQSVKRGDGYDEQKGAPKNGSMLWHSLNPLRTGTSADWSAQGPHIDWYRLRSGLPAGGSGDGSKRIQKYRDLESFLSQSDSQKNHAMDSSRGGSQES
jgi:hypothetical protein